MPEQPDTETVSLADLGVTDDPGTSWHPRQKPGARTANGDLPDLTDDEVAEHMEKPEGQTDLARRERDGLDAEDSQGSPFGQV